MKIAIIMPLAEQRGGGELALLNLMQQGNNSGIIWVVVFLENGPMVKQVRKMGIEAQVIVSNRLRDVPRTVATIFSIALLIRLRNIDLVLGWMNQGQLYGSPAAFLAAVPSVWFQHGIPLVPGWGDRMATRLPAAGILTCSRAGAAAQAAIAPSRPLRVVYPGVELDRFDPSSLPAPADMRRTLGMPVSGPLIGIVGRLQHWKGMHVLIAAMPEILATHPDAHCVIVGGPHAPEPEYPASLTAQISTLGLETKVTMVGLQPNVPEWMQAMDVIVHASDHEPFGIVVIEAMALGKPTIAGNTAGPTEIITDGVDGLLTPFEDAPALAHAVKRYLGDPAFAAQLGVAGRERAQEFSTARYAEAVIRETLSLVRPKSGSTLNSGSER